MNLNHFKMFNRIIKIVLQIFLYKLETLFGFRLMSE